MTKKVETYQDKYDDAVKGFTLRYLYITTIFIFLTLVVWWNGIIYLFRFLMCILITIHLGAIIVVHNLNILAIIKIYHLYSISAILLLFPMALFSLNVGDITPSLWLVAAPVLISVLQQGKKLIYWDIVIFTFLFTICALPTILTICGNDALSALVNSLYNMVDYPQGSQLWYYLRSSKIMAIFTIFVLVCYAVHYRDKLHKIRLEELYEQLTRNNDNELIKRIKTIADEDDDDESKRYDKLYNRIVEYMEMNRPFTKKDFSAAQLSIALNINASYLSLAINAKRNMNFNTFVNTYRIENVKKMIRFNSKKYTLEHIYLSSGFKNQSTFNKAFKQYEGITPTEYIKKLNDNSMISEFQ